LKDTPAAVRALKYMLLSKIMGGQYEDVYAAINGKAGVKYAGIEIAAMRAITDAYKARSIHKFQQVQQRYNTGDESEGIFALRVSLWRCAHLVFDVFVCPSCFFFQVYAEFAPQLAHDLLLSTHLGELQEKLLEHNLLRLLEPFSRVQIAHVATLIKLDRPQVEAKLSEMILDNKLNGILDQVR
jgi:26S proteasome regulatory subunit N6